MRGPVQRIDLDPNGWLPDPGSTVQYDPALVLAAIPAAPTASVGAYPNPCREQLLLSGLPAAPVVAEVRNALGQLVLRQALSAAQPVLATTGLAPGLYVLQLVGPAGQAIGRVRFARE